MTDERNKALETLSTAVSRLESAVDFHLSRVSAGKEALMEAGEALMEKNVLSKEHEALRRAAKNVSERLDVLVSALEGNGDGG